LIHLVLCWHFHQPDYRNESGEYLLPWTYLHAMKDYADMAAHLEANPDLRAVVNFVPTLLEQLDDYADQFQTGRLRDSLLARLVDPNLGRMKRADRLHLVEACFRLNAPTMLDPFPGYRRLKALWDTTRESDGEAMLEYLSADYLADLVTWYHLAWTGETVRKAHPWLLEMLAKGAGFTLEERESLFRLIGNLIANLVPRFRALAARGQIELSATPHSHPIAPLLIDFQSAREAKPGLPLPLCSAYPGGAARVKAHVDAALKVHAKHFGKPPQGFWPAEGGVSASALARFSEAGIRWVASGEGVLRHSLAAVGQDVSRPCQWLFRPYRLADQQTACFFRDDYLSDLIGFEYKGWFARDAVRHLLHVLEERYHQAPSDNPVVSIVLDGENAWEYYPYNGWYFLAELYRALNEHPHIRTTTFSEYLDFHPEATQALPQLLAGSWVFGDFTTWIGDAAKNRAWDLLCAAKTAYDQAIGQLDKKSGRAAEAQLMSCESSDWFWWFGDSNPAESVTAFDRLFRAKLKALYKMLKLPVPKVLDVPLCQGGGLAEAGGVMRRGGA
jgi:alpha-amylase/alpha-mannosidase (GH57 family)